MSRSHRFLGPSAAVLTIAGLSAAPVGGQQRTGANASGTDTAVVPESGFDVSAVQHFFRMVDTLSLGIRPGEAQWEALFRTPGYELAKGNVPTFRRDMEIAFGPWNEELRDSLLDAGGSQAARLRHLTRAASLRAELTELARELQRSPPFDEAIERASAYLPHGVTATRDPPFVALAVFRYDGYAGPRGAIIDMLYVLDNGLVPLLSHEFHHVFAGDLDRGSAPPQGSPETPLMRVLSALRTEGIADLVDKPFPLTAGSPGMEPYVRRYNEEYRRTLEVVETFDSLLIELHEDPDRMEEVGRRSRVLFWSNGHPHGAYMARTIDEVLGRRAVIDALRSPFDFLRSFAEAERRKSGVDVFSSPSEAVLEALERSYGG